MRFFLTVICFVIIPSTLCAQADLLKPDPSFVVDKSAEFPGGISSLNTYIADNLFYPGKAAIRGIEGKVFVQFIVGVDGRVVKSSVNVLSGFDEDCNKAAIKVIEGCRVFWKPARKNNQNVQQAFVLPITFKMDVNPTIQRYQQKLSSFSAKTVITKKPGTPKNPAWQLYSDISLTKPSGYLSPGDTVEVIGWGPYLVGIQKGYRTGYVSWLAVQVTEELESVMKMIEQDSPAFEKELAPLDSINRTKAYSAPAKIRMPQNRKGDKMYFQNPIIHKNAFLALTTSKRKLVVGECAVVDLAFYVNDNNRVPLQFHELGRQLQAIIKNELAGGTVWSSSNNIHEIEGESIELDSNAYTMYRLYSGSYCPTSVIPIEFKSINLKLLQRNSPLDKDGVIVTFSADPLIIPVNPLPSTAIQTSKYDFYSLVGNFNISETLLETNPIVNNPVLYSVSIKGKGLTFPITAPTISVANCKAFLLSMKHADTIINNQYHSEKTFTYSLTFIKEGYYDFSSFFKFSAYNPLSKRIEMHVPQGKIPVKANNGNRNEDLMQIPFFHKDNVIAIDASTSMMIEDYFPNRLGVVKQGLEKFFSIRTKCDVGVLLFGAEAHQYNVTLHDSCFTASQIKQIDFNMVQSGTAIGNAIWLAINSTTTDGLYKKVVIIGDGDNTAGNLTIDLAIALAKRRNVKVYTIGIGNTGLVPFGKDFFGQNNMVEDTFSDIDFKKISMATGGKYYWAKDSKAIEKCLLEIFGN